MGTVKIGARAWKSGDQFGSANGIGWTVDVVMRDGEPWQHVHARSAGGEARFFYATEEVEIPDAPATKETNPKDAIGVQKPYFSPVSEPFVAYLGLAMLEGACKYRSHNYRVAGVRVSTHYNAMRRHMAAFWEGEDVDAQSGLPHIVKAAACLAVLFDSMCIQKNATDDRPPRSPDGWLAEVERLTVELLARFPEPAPPHTHVEEVAKLAERIERSVVAPFVVLEGKIGPGEPDGGPSFEMPVSGTLESVRVDGVDYPVGGARVPEREPELVEPARILARDLTKDHEGLRFRVQFADREEGGLTPYVGFVGTLRYAEDCTGEAQFAEGPYGEDSTGFCVGPKAVLEYVPE